MQWGMDAQLACIVITGRGSAAPGHTKIILNFHQDREAAGKLSQLNLIARLTNAAFTSECHHRGGECYFPTESHRGQPTETRGLRLVYTGSRRKTTAKKAAAKKAGGGRHSELRGTGTIIRAVDTELINTQRIKEHLHLLKPVIVVGDCAYIT